MLQTAAGTGVIFHLLSPFALKDGAQTLLPTMPCFRSAAHGAAARFQTRRVSLRGRVSLSAGPSHERQAERGDANAAISHRGARSVRRFSRAAEPRRIDRAGGASQSGSPAFPPR